jgi:DNA-binding protein H-NS
VRAAIVETLAEFNMTLENIAPQTGAGKAKPATAKRAPAKQPAKKASLKVVGTKKRKGNYPRGPQPAKYRDPESGAEWSGRGKAPAWIVGDKDAFLIAAA